MRREKFFGMVFVAALLLLVGPVAAYIYTFGFTVSSKHSVWAEMGSAMSGIYGPLLALLTLGLLFVQLLIQRESTRLQQDTSKHMYDQAHLQSANDQIAYYLGRLDITCNKFDQSGVTVGQRLMNEFRFLQPSEMQHPDATATARRFDGDYPQIFAAWLAYQAVLAGLQSVDEQLYEVAFAIGRNKANVTLSLALCSSLDHAVWCWCEGNLRGPYLFGRVPT